MKVQAPLLLLALLALLAPVAVSARRSNNRKGAKNRNVRCGVASCKRCQSGNRTACETCYLGFARTEDNQCAHCGEGCRSCAVSGVCDVCKKGYTRSRLTSQCLPCSRHCDVCDAAGHGGCDECKDRHMLHVYFPHDGEGERHECLPCSKGCARCEIGDADGAAHCLSCESFHTALPHGDGCAFSYTKVLMVLAVVALVIGGCLFACTFDEDGPWGEPPPRRRVPAKREDTAEVVRRSATRVLDSYQGDSAGGMRGRRRAEESRFEEITPDLHAGSSPAHHAMVGYS